MQYKKGKHEVEAKKLGRLLFQMVSRTIKLNKSTKNKKFKRFKLQFLSFKMKFTCKIVYNKSNQMINYLA